MRMFKKGTWQWSTFNDQPVPFPVFVLPARKQKKGDPYHMALERRGPWYICPVFTRRDEPFAKHVHAGWIAVAPYGTRQGSNWSVVFKAKAQVIAWCDRQPLPKHFSLVATKGDAA